MKKFIIDTLEMQLIPKSRKKVKCRLEFEIDLENLNALPREFLYQILGVPREEIPVYEARLESLSDEELYQILASSASNPGKSGTIWDSLG